MTVVLVLADTHLKEGQLAGLPETVWQLADEADVILHAGDVVDGALLDALAQQAPVHAVRGNNDGALGRLPDDLVLDLGGVRIALVHDSGERRGREQRMFRRFPDADAVVFGHSHQPMAAWSPQGQLLFNPGSPTQRRRAPQRTVGLLTIGAGQIVDHQIVPVADAGGG
jgi:putative phosphoesterase